MVAHPTGLRGHLALGDHECAVFPAGKGGDVLERERCRSSYFDVHGDIRGPFRQRRSQGFGSLPKECHSQGKSSGVFWERASPLFLMSVLFPMLGNRLLRLFEIRPH